MGYVFWIQWPVNKTANQTSFTPDRPTQMWIISDFCADWLVCCFNLMGGWGGVSSCSVNQEIKSYNPNNDTHRDKEMEGKALAKQKPRSWSGSSRAIIVWVPLFSGWHSHEDTDTSPWGLWLSLITGLRLLQHTKAHCYHHPEEGKSPHLTTSASPEHSEITQSCRLG